MITVFQLIWFTCLFSYPQVTNTLNAADAPQPSFLIFYSSVDPSTGKMWCPVS